MVVGKDICLSVSIPSIPSVFLDYSINLRAISSPGSSASDRRSERGKSIPTPGTKGLRGEARTSLSNRTSPRPSQSPDTKSTISFGDFVAARCVSRSYSEGTLGNPYMCCTTAVGGFTTRSSALLAYTTGGYPWFCYSVLCSGSSSWRVPRSYNSFWTAPPPCPQPK